MDETKLSVEAGQTLEVVTESKKDYETPAVIFERPLEALAAVCPPQQGGKAGGNCTTLFS